MSELGELLVECVRFNRKGVSDELGDFLMAAQCWAATVTGLDWPMVISIKTLTKYTQRIKRWEAIFAAEGLEFDPKYLTGGGNHAKPEKVLAALSLARRDQPWQNVKRTGNQR